MVKQYNSISIAKPNLKQDKRAAGALEYAILIACTSAIAATLAVKFGSQLVIFFKAVAAQISVFNT